MRSKQFLTLLATVGIAVGGTLTAATASADPGSYAKPTVLAGSMIQSTDGTNRCLTVAGYNSLNGAAVVMWNCNRDDNQLWSFENGQVKSGLAGNRCLDIVGANGENGAALNLFDCRGWPAQQWEWFSGNMLYNRAANKCIAVNNATKTNGGSIHMWNCDGPAHQRWTIS
jgi:hypothetical protein